MFGTGSSSAARRRGLEEKARTHAADLEAGPRERLPPSRSKVRVAAIAKTQLLTGGRERSRVRALSSRCSKLARSAARDHYITQHSHVIDPPEPARMANQRGTASAVPARQAKVLLHSLPLVLSPNTFDRPFASGAETVDIFVPLPILLRFPCVALFFLRQIPLLRFFYTPSPSLRGVPVRRLSHPR